MGLIAANGRGKSSLLRCLAGELEASAGDITRARGVTLCRVEQDVPHALRAITLREAATRNVFKIAPVARDIPERMQIVGLAANSSVEALVAQVRETGVKQVALTDPAAAAKAPRGKRPKRDSMGAPLYTRSPDARSAQRGASRCKRAC